MKKLLEWKERDGTKIAEGKSLMFAYQKVKNRHLLLIEEDGLAIRLICKTERDCLVISNILNKV